MQHLADTVSSDADRRYMLVMGLALAGRAAAQVVDAGRLQAWLAIPTPGESNVEAANRAAQAMMLYHKWCAAHHTCGQPAGVLAAAAHTC